MSSSTACMCCTPEKTKKAGPGTARRTRANIKTRWRLDKMASPSLPPNEFFLFHDKPRKKRRGGLASPFGSWLGASSSFRCGLRREGGFAREGQLLSPIIAPPAVGVSLGKFGECLGRRSHTGIVCHLSGQKDYAIHQFLCPSTALAIKRLLLGKFQREEIRVYI